jgi:general secretion pathway protein D
MLSIESDRSCTPLGSPSRVLNVRFNFRTFDIKVPDAAMELARLGRTTPTGKLLTSEGMRILLSIAGLCLSLIFVHAGTLPSEPASPVAPERQSKNEHGPTCASKGTKECHVSDDSFKKARKAFECGTKLKKTHPEEALDALNIAVKLEPQNVQYVSARELLVQQLAYEHLERGNRLLSEADSVAAAREFRKTLELDPHNQFASERLLDATNPLIAEGANGRKSSERPAAYIEPEWDEQEIILHPKAGAQILRLRGATGSAYAQIGAAFDIKVSLDSSTPDRSVRLDLNQVTFEQAMNAVALVTHTFWTPLSSSKVLVGADTPATRKELERWLLRTFYLPKVATPQTFDKISSLLRNLFDLRSVTQSASNGTITVRGPVSKVLAATQFLRTLRSGQPQMMLDVDVYEISRQLLHDIGITLPSQFSIFNISQSNNISQLNTSPVLNGTVQHASIRGAVQQAVSQGTGLDTVLPALTSQVRQQNALVAPLQSSVPTFGGGKSLMGVLVPPVTGSFSKNESRAISLSKVSLRGSQGNKTIFRLGTRYPIVTASYQAGINSAALPTITYEDIGIAVTGTPTIHEQDVTLDLEVELSSLGSLVFNGVPAINQRSYKGTITVRKDEPAVIASSVSRSELRSMQGIPGLANVAVLGRITSERSTEDDDEELLILITPHVIDNVQDVDDTEVYLPSNN